MPSSVVTTSSGEFLRVNDATLDVAVIADTDLNLLLDVAIGPRGAAYGVAQEGFGSALYRFDLDDGSYRRVAPFTGLVNGLFIAENGLGYAADAFQGVITTFRPDTGRVVDTVSYGGSGSAGDLVVRGDKAYVLTNARTLDVVDLDTGRVVDSFDHGRFNAFGLVEDGRQLRFFAGGDEAYRIDPRTGAVRALGDLDGSPDVYGASDVPVIARTGSDRGEALRGTLWDDRISARGGNDEVLAGQGDDEVRGGSGRDRLIGGQGADRLHGDGGDDALDGGGGADRLSGGAGDDVLTGGSGADAFVFTDGRDRVRGFRDDADTLVLDDRLWDGERLSRSEVLAEFATARSGRVVLDFGQGDVLTVEGISRPRDLLDDLAFA